jgi:hypothetical protein
LCRQAAWSEQHAARSAALQVVVRCRAAVSDTGEHALSCVTVVGPTMLELRDHSCASAADGA